MAVLGRGLHFKKKAGHALFNNSPCWSNIFNGGIRGSGCWCASFKFFVVESIESQERVPTPHISSTSSTACQTHQCTDIKIYSPRQQDTYRPLSGAGLLFLQLEYRSCSQRKSEELISIRSAGIKRNSSVSGPIFSLLGRTFWDFRNRLSLVCDVVSIVWKTTTPQEHNVPFFLNDEDVYPTMNMESWQVEDESEILLRILSVLTVTMLGITLKLGAWLG